MKKQRIRIGLLLAVMFVATACAGENGAGTQSSSTKEAEAVPENAPETAASLSVNETPANEAEAGDTGADLLTETFEEANVTGVVIDATMSGLVVQSGADGLYRFVYGEETPDDAGLANGIRLGSGITVTYAGGGTETVHTAVKLADAKTACDEPEALMAAGEAILTLEAGGSPLNLWELYGFPLTVGDETFEDQTALKDRVGDADFTLMGENCVKAIREADLNAVSLDDKNVLSLNGAAGSGIDIERVNYEWKITAIRP